MGARASALVQRYVFLGVLPAQGNPGPRGLLSGASQGPPHLHTVVEGSQSLGLVVLREGSAQTAMPLVSLCTGAVGTSWS